jgi:trans-2,3-dihydro-3-hydroxyanthranilate isomerase
LLFVLLRTRAPVDRAVLNRQALQTLCTTCKVTECPVSVFSMDQADDDALVYSRMFAPIFGVAEDPATGGASGPLGAYLAKYCSDSVATMSSPCSTCRVSVWGGPTASSISLSQISAPVPCLEVGGEAVFVGEGTLVF